MAKERGRERGDDLRERDDNSCVCPTNNKREKLYNVSQVVCTERKHIDTRIDGGVCTIIIT